MKDYEINFKDACSKCAIPSKPVEPKPTPLPIPPTSRCELRKIVKIVAANGKVFVVYDDCSFTAGDLSIVDFKSLMPKTDIKDIEKQLKELQETINKQSNELKKVKESCKCGSHESPEDLITIYNAKGKPSFKAHKLPNELPNEPSEPEPKTPPDLPAPPAEKPKNKMSKVIFKRVDLPPEGWNLDSHATILGELTGKVGSEIPTTIYDEYAKSSKYLKFVSSDFTPPMYFPDSETPTVFTITMQRLPIQHEDGAATATFKFIKQGTKETLKEVNVGGTIGFKIPTTEYDKALTELQNQGYTLVSTTFNPPSVFTGDSRDKFEIIMEEIVVPFDPNNPPTKPNPPAPDGYPNDPMDSKP